MNYKLKDIAEKASVSIATVSRVLNSNIYNVTPETKSKVFDAMIELGYSHQNIADMIEQAKNSKNSFAPSKAVGCILSNFEKHYMPYFSIVLKEIESEIYKRGYSLYYLYAEDNLKDTIIFHNIICNNEVNNLILVGGVEEEDFSTLCSKVKNLVCIDGGGNLKHSKKDMVTSDFFFGSYDITKHLINLGHRSIGFIGGPVSNIHRSMERPYEGETRYLGFLKALEDNGIQPNNEIIKNGKWELEHAYNSMIEILSSNSKPTAIVCASDTMALGALRAVQKKGLIVPNDIAVVGFDNIEMSEYSCPALTTVDIDKKQLGRLAVKTLIDRINGELTVPIQIYLSTRLVIRESCGANK